MSKIESLTRAVERLEAQLKRWRDGGERLGVTMLQANHHYLIANEITAPVARMRESVDAHQQWLSELTTFVHEVERSSTDPTLVGRARQLIENFKPREGI